MIAMSGTPQATAYQSMLRDVLPTLLATAWASRGLAN
jgi:hypothetical protein